MKKLKRLPDRRSDCPLNCTLELIGDRWSLLIIRDILFFGKTSYNEFLSSPEKIATNILKDRLTKLTETGVLTYTGSDKRKKYAVTKLGLDLKPVIEAILIFGMKHFEGTKEYVYVQMKKNKV